MRKYGRKLEFKVFIKGLPTQRVLVGANYDNTTDPITITLKTAGDYTYFKAGHVVMNERTLEVMWVTSVDTSNNKITCKRNVGTSKAAGQADDGLIIIGSAHEEGADTPTEITYDPTVVTNYTQFGCAAW